MTIYVVVTKDYKNFDEKIIEIENNHKAYISKDKAEKVKNILIQSKKYEYAYWYELELDLTK